MEENSMKHKAKTVIVWSKISIMQLHIEMREFVCVICTVNDPLLKFQ